MKKNQFAKYYPIVNNKAQDLFKKHLLHVTSNYKLIWLVILSNF